MPYQSPEQIAAAALIPLGCINVNDKMLSYTFADENGTFNAKADLYHPLLDLYIEIKDAHLNGKTSKATAERAYARLDPERLRKYPTYCQIETQWNHAAKKHAIVQSTIGAAQYAVVFTGKPDEETLSRIQKHGIQALSLSRFKGMLQLQMEFQQKHV